MTPTDDWVAELAKATTPEEALRVFVKRHAEFDIINASHRVLAAGEDLSFTTTVSSGWLGYYLDQGYSQIDPGVQNATTAVAPLVNCFDPRHPLFPTDQATGQLFFEAGEAIGRSAFCIHFRSRWGVNMVSMYSDVTAKDFDIWNEAFGAQMAMRAAALNEKIQSLLFDELEDVTNSTALSPRELDCVRWLAAGYRVNAIAHKLDISDRTVEFHISNARQKLNAPTRESLVAKVLLSTHVPNPT